jgi:hypothetical protein
MDDQTISDADLDKFQVFYKACVERWIAAIREEEMLALVNHSAAQLDRWQMAHQKEELVRSEVLAAKKGYEDALRLKIFNF